MRCLLILLAVAGVAIGKPTWLGLGIDARNHYRAPVAYSSVISPVAISSQYHSQDELGQYSYGYAGGPSSKSEVKTWDGVTRGGYSYVDPEGKLQNVNYVSDPVHGFRVAATNLPVAPDAIPAEPLEAPVPVEDTPEVAAAREEHFALYAEAKAAADAAPDDPEPVSDVAAEPVVTIPTSVAPVVTHPAYHTNVLPYSYPIAAPASRFAYPYATPASRFAYPYATPASRFAYPYATPTSRFAYSYASPAYYPTPTKYYAYGAVPPAPVAHAPAPHIYSAPHLATSQYHAQDGIGQYSYGYSGGPSAKSEVKTWDGVTRGGYSYVDAEGKVQNVNYVSDPIHGFRVAATNLPVGPQSPVLETVPDTPEVAAAKSAHLAAWEETKSSHTAQRNSVKAL